MVDIRPHPGDNSGPVRELLRDLCSARLRPAPRVDSTGSVGSTDRGSHPPAAPLEHLPTLSEDELLRAHGLDPTDFEAELLERRPLRFDDEGTVLP